MKFLKKYLLDILVVIAFAIISFVHFMPADMDGRILFRHDAAAGKDWDMKRNSSSSRRRDYTMDELGVWRYAYLSDVAFVYDSNQVLSQIVKAYHLWLPDYVWYVLYTSWVSISCCVPSTSDGRWRRWEVSSGHSRPTFYHYRCRTYLEGMGTGFICRR